ncbi:hypothetical protein [Microbacterium sp. LWH13-1.2]|uniref:hypothetical protein n=1 Tax=Microbacterium sp. LWH13-1.2 TaxID=3135260 RepID=UPI00313A38C6
MSVIGLIAIILYVLGLALTGWGLFSAVVTTQRDIIRSKDRLATLKNLEARQHAESRELSEQQAQDWRDIVSAATTPVPDQARKDWDDRWSARFAVMHARQDQEFAELDSTRATLDNLPHLAQFESQWLLQRILDSNRGNLVLLGSGLVVTTIGSIASVFA